MPALRTTPARLPHFVPHLNSGPAGTSTRTGRGAGAFLETASTLPPSPKTSPDRRDTLARLAHDVRNVFSSLLLYGNLLSAPGVLGPEHSHFAPELESMAQSAVGLMEKILALAASDPAPSAVAPPPATMNALPTLPVTDLAAELRQMQPLLAAIAGPAVRVSLAAMPCAGLTRLAVEDLTRIMVNLIRNAADAMPYGGEVRITAQYGEGHSFLDGGSRAAFRPPSGLLLTVSDNGPGIPAHLRTRIFKTGFTTRNQRHSPGAPVPCRRGLGLNTVRQLIESAGGTISVASPSVPGARFEISLPLLDPENQEHYLGNVFEL